MRRRWILIVSVGLNVLLGVVLFAARHRSTHSAAQAASAQPAGANQVRTRVVVRKQFFSWQELESPEYRAYITNLRDIGCPEQTVRDIIVADVNQLYAKKRAAEVPTPDQQWWRAEPDTNAVQAATAAILALDQERRSLLTTLLGPNWDGVDPAPRPLAALNGPVLGELSVEAKNSVQEIIVRSQQRTQAYLDAQKSAGRTADPAELARLGLQTRSELAQLLTPAQLEEFLLRYSQTAASLREQLRGIEVTPDEFRRLFRATDPIEQRMELAGGNAQERTAQQAALAKPLAEAMKDVLGPERYQAYRLAQDPVYRDAVSLAEDAGAPPEAAQKIYDLNKAVIQEQNGIRSDARLTDEQKTQELKTLEQQLQLASDQVLGLAPPTPPPLPPVPTAQGPAQVHPYSPGETIDQIAAKYGVTPNSILNANPNLNFNGLTRGAAINIPHQP